MSRTCNLSIIFSKFTTNKIKNSKSLMVLEILEKKKKTLSIIYYLDRYLSQCLWFGTPFKHPLRHLRQFFLLDSVHFSRNSSSWGFFFLFWFWKQINCFEIMCFWKFWETLELLLILSTRSTLSALVFQRTASKSRFFFFFFGIDFSFEALYLDFFDTLLNFLDTHYLI